MSLIRKRSLVAEKIHTQIFSEEKKSVPPRAISNVSVIERNPAR